MFLERSLRGSAQRLAAFTVVLLLASASSRLASAQSAGKGDLSSADIKAFTSYRLTLEKLNQLDAANRKLSAALGKDPVLVKEINGQGAAANAGESLEESLGKFDSRAPHLTAVIKSAGMTNRDYVMTVASIMLANSGKELKQAAPDKPMPAFFSAENIAFAEKNSARFAEVLKNLESVNTLARGNQPDHVYKSRATVKDDNNQ